MAKLDLQNTVAPRKQPKQRRSIATVGFILDAAAHILEERGLENYTTNAIAERAGISIGSCYQYFPSKEAITVALIARETAQLANELEQAGKVQTWQAGIKLAISAAVAHQMSRPRLALQLDLVEHVLTLDSEHTSVQVQAQSIIARLLKLDDAPKVKDPGLASADLVAMAHGMIDSAGRRGETDAGSLNRRVLQAITGYLNAGA